MTTDPKILDLIFKDQLHLYLQSCGLPTYPTYLEIDNVPDDAYPIICKRNMSRGGDGSYIVKSKREAMLLLDFVDENCSECGLTYEKYIFQPIYYHSHHEYLTIDIYFSLTGDIVQIIPFRSLRKDDFLHALFEVLLDPNIIASVEKMLYKLDIDFRGVINMDGVWDGQNFMPIDVNARPTKVIALSYLAGFDYYGNLFKYVNGIAFKKMAVKDRLIVGRVERNLIVNNELEFIHHGQI